MGLFDRIFNRPANWKGSISREAYPVSRASTALTGLDKLVGNGYVQRFESSLKYDGFDTIMAKRKKLLGIYSGKDTNSHLKDKFTASTLKEVILADSNIVDRAIRRMSLLYKDAPEYTFTGEGKLPDEYPSVKRWLSMKNAERLSNLLGTVAIRPVARGDNLQWDVLWYFVPLISADGGTELDGIAYPLSNETDPKRWAVFTKEEMYIGDTETQAKEAFPGRGDMTNPYKRVPFTLVHPKYPTDNCLLVPGYGGPLANANDNLILGMTEGGLGVRFNMMGQFWTKGLDKKNEISLGTNKVPNLPDQGELNQVGPTGDFDGAIAYLKFLIEQALQSVGLQVQWGDSADAPSGESLKIKSIELIERREDDVPTWREGDRSVYEDERVVSDVDLNKKMPELERINFAEMSFPKAPSEARDQAEWDWEQGFDTPAAYLKRRDPDGFEDKKAAQKFIDDNKEAQPAAQPRLDLFPKRTVPAA